MTRWIPLLGILTILLAAWLLSKNRKAINWRIVAWGLSLQIVVALFVLRTHAGFWLIEKIAGVFVKLLNYSFAGSSFVFGPLGRGSDFPMLRGVSR
jgi:CNT family concentrative nucleoside transporter